MNNNENRKYVLLLIFISIGLLITFRLFYMQVMDDKWVKRAVVISENRVETYAPRGVIFDRKNNIIVNNATYYDLMVVPKYAKKIDTLGFCELLGIDKEEYIKRIKKAKRYSYRVPSVFEAMISAADYEKMVEKLYLYNGFYGEERTLRRYPHNVGAVILGNTGPINHRELKKDKYYRRTDFVGKQGVELFYEKELRGKRGVRYYLKDAIGRKTGKYEGGRYDTLPKQGAKLNLSIDIALQAYGEKLMQGKRGSIVAIEPKTGELLCLVSAPSYNPNLLVGRERGRNYGVLQKDTLSPLFNRATLSLYPPGSIFKLMQTAIGLEEGVLNVNTSFPCHKNLVGCHNHPTAKGVSDAIKMSCNPYFYYAMKRIVEQGKDKSIFKDANIGLQKWGLYAKSFGFGQRLGTDIPFVEKGFIPPTTFYDRYYGKHRWAFSTIFSISIGQGEVQLIPLQMANLAAIIANKGYYITPHLLKSIEGELLPVKYTTKNYTLVDSSHFSIIIDGMKRVINEAGGTARRGKVKGIDVCGKTGTAQNPHGEDHSVFIAFAPADNPRIAISVFLENAGFGGTWAAPIASLMIEKYLKDSITDVRKEKRILEADFINVK